MKKHIIIAALFLLATSMFSTAQTAGITYTPTGNGCCELTNAKDASGSVTIPETADCGGELLKVTAIADSAFSYNKALTAVRLPSSVTEIGKGAFMYCTSLASIEFGDAPVVIAEDAFRSCPRLKSVSVSSVSQWLRMKFANDFSSPLCAYCPLTVAGETLVNLTVPDEIEALGRYALADCKKLRSVKLHGGIASVGNHAFDGCVDLQSFEAEEGLREIGDFAFSVCTSLSGVVLPQSLTTLGTGTFYSCASLNLSTLPGTMEIIPPLCFSGCESITEIPSLPGSVWGIGQLAFYHCGNLQRAMLPESVTAVGQSAFQECPSLEEVSVANENSFLSGYVFQDCTSLKHVKLPAAMDSIPEGLFFNCHALEEVDVPATVFKISGFAFAQCSSLRYIAFPEHLNHIGQLAFYGCTGLQELEFGRELQRIDAEAFYYCYGLKEIHLPAIEPVAISYFTFDPYLDRNCRLVVPEVSLQLYREAYGWKLFSDIVGNPDYNPDTTLTILFGYGGGITRTQGYGATMKLNLIDLNGNLPRTVMFNGTDITDTMNALGAITTPPVTGPSVLEIK
ncbi:MAG: leucine-rich repeat domain-containing protein [Firmicutes bacterium]|nr:leucine-rich repeat domain-containing protein [Bacillota bacterium]MCM1401583.1 leucine-rich repeat domain-containing protein [Bacteroides sp.]MCM1477467.1 leucine-rich repeat domain-containing protein [Bacteroides sp.]